VAAAVAAVFVATLVLVTVVELVVGLLTKIRSTGRSLRPLERGDHGGADLRQQPDDDPTCPHDDHHLEHDHHHEHDDDLDPVLVDHDHRRRGDHYLDDRTRIHQHHRTHRFHQHDVEHLDGARGSEIGLTPRSRGGGVP
jgi:hypothetical protein